MSHRIEWADCGWTDLTEGEMSRVVGGETWAYSDDPSGLSSKYTFTLATLPSKGSATIVPTAGNYWPA